MNLVLDDAEELSLKQKTRKPLGAPRRPRTLRAVAAAAAAAAAPPPPPPPAAAAATARAAQLR